ncbi:MAG TPA: alpha/beta hydrolase [bacterium]|nr:alpha/beta hydrolase [bacterium]HOM27413.1 alpha/beta hydrolase [bacterium]
MKLKIFLFVFLFFISIFLPAQNIKIPENVEIIKDVVYGEVDGKKLLLDIVKPEKNEGKMPVIVFVHGGAWRGGDKQGGIYRLIQFAEKGYFCVTINYRLSQEAKFPAQIEDCKCAIRFLRGNSEKYNIDQDKIGVWGPSAGGHLVALLGTTGDIKEFEGNGGWKEYSSRVNAVCDWFGPSDFLTGFEKSNKEGSPYKVISELIGGEIELLKEKAKKASPVYYVNKDCPPFLIMHGDKDNVVPYVQSVILYNKLKENNVPVTLVKIKDGGHGTGFKKKAMDFVESFFDFYLKGEKEKWQSLRGNNDFIEIPAE